MGYMELSSAEPGHRVDGDRSSAAPTFCQLPRPHTLPRLHFRSDASATATLPADGSGKMYPAMTQPEIEEWLEHIPVFAVTDSNGAGVVLKPENDTSVF